MSIYFNVSEEDMINLRKLAEQQKNHRALENKNGILKQTHDIKLAENLSPITKKLNEVEESTEIVGDIIKESNSADNNIRALPNSSNFSKSMREMLGSLMSSHNFLKITQDGGYANILGVPIQISGADTIKINKIIYELTPEIYKALSSTAYTGNTMKNEDDILMMFNIVRDLAYTGVGDKKSNRKTFFIKTLPKLAEGIQNKTFDEVVDDSDDIQGGVKIIIPSNNIDFYTRLEILLGLKLSGHTDTLTEASNLIDELYKKGEIQNKLQYRNALNKFSTQ